MPVLLDIACCKMDRIQVSLCLAVSLPTPSASSKILSTRVRIFFKTTIFAPSSEKYASTPSVFESFSNVNTAAFPTEHALYNL